MYSLLFCLPISTLPFHSEPKVYTRKKTAIPSYSLLRHLPSIFLSFNFFTSCRIRIGNCLLTFRRCCVTFFFIQAGLVKVRKDGKKEMKQRLRLNLFQVWSSTGGQNTVSKKNHALLRKSTRWLRTAQFTSRSLKCYLCLTRNN